MKKRILLIAFMLTLIVSAVFALCSCNNDQVEGPGTACEHVFVEVASTLNLKSAATCTSQAEYYKVCEKCGSFSTDTFKSGALESHNYVDDVCTRCKKINEDVFDSLSSTKGYVLRGDDVYFGEYPQSIVIDSSTLNSLNTSAGQLPSYSSYGYWQSFGYVEYLTTAEYMWYQDISLGGKKYRGIYFVSYRPEFSSNQNTESYSNQDDNGYYTSSVYWFKFEPIRWHILSSNFGEALAVASLALDSQSYNLTTNSNSDNGQKVYASNYEYSAIRTWLNASFYQTAFNSIQKQLIVAQTNDNKTTSDNIENQFAIIQNDTQDNVFLLSYQDLMNSKYGINTSESRIRTSTDYAQALGIFMGNGSYLNNAKWWTRSANLMYGYQVYAINQDGNFTSSDVDSTQYGIVPALKMRICSSTNPLGHDFVENSDEIYVKTQATCTTPAIYYKSCQICGAKSEEVFEYGQALGHDYIEDPNDDCIKSPSSCIARAVFYKSCSRCGDKSDDTFEYGDILEHEYVRRTIAPTCVDKGYVSYKCDGCGDETKSDFTEALGHVIDNIIKDEYLESPATCTSPAIYHKSCTRCGAKMVETFEEGKALGHDYDEIINNKYICTPATCDKHATYYKGCTRCGAVSTEVFGFGSPLTHDYFGTTISPTCVEQGYTIFECSKCHTTYTGDYTKAKGHTYVDSICEDCGKVNLSNGYLKVGKTIYFGTYPQTLVESTTLIQALNKQAGILPTVDNNQLWTSYDYYFNGANGEPHMWYIDIPLYGDTYRGVYFDEYRDSSVLSELADSGTHYQLDNGYVKDNVYWFRFDAIKWNILTAQDNSALLVCSLVIDSQNYNTTNLVTTMSVYPNDWATSDIRNWLKTTFYNSAFSKSEQALIRNVNISNINRNGKSSSTNDYVYLMSTSDLSNSLYGYNSISSIDNNRMLEASEYSKSQGVSLVQSVATWWSRSPKQNDNNVKDMQIIGNTGFLNYANVASTYVGVVPVININLTPCSSNHDYLSQVIAPTCTEKGYTLHVCKNCGYSYTDHEVKANGHSFVDGICSNCDTIEEYTVNYLLNTKGYARNGERIFFGTYPQKLFINESIENVLITKAGAIPTTSNSGNWISYGYYNEGNNDEAYVWYQDVLYNNQWYRGIYFTAYRPYDYREENISDNSFVKDNGYYSETIYWFTFDPIEWLLISSDSETITMVSLLAIDTQPFYYGKSSHVESGETVYANNWEYSFVRDWLNKDFYSKAFSNIQKSLIETQFTYNKYTCYGEEANTKYGLTQRNTVDAITLPSYSFFTNSENGYENEIAQQWLRQSESTDYAKALGTNRENEGAFDANCINLSRSAHGSETAVVCINTDGSLSEYAYYHLGGIVPLITIKSVECIEGHTHSYIDGICEFCGKINQTEFDAAFNSVSGKGFATNGKVIYYGTSPQSLVLEQNIIDGLNGQLNTSTNNGLPSKYNNENNGWTSYEYYYGNTNTVNYYWYIEKVFDNNKYRGVYFDSNRQIDNKALQEYLPVSIMEFEQKTVYWFKYEPIKWDILNIDDNGQALLMSSIILDSQNFNDRETALVKNSNNYLPNNYEESYLNNALNTYFLSNSFTEKQRQYIVESTLITIPTRDQVKALSSVSENEKDSTKQRKASDYAKVDGLKVGGNEHKYGQWLTMTPYETDGLGLYYVNFNGQIKSSASVTNVSYGIVPVLYFNFRHKNNTDHEYANVVNEKYLKNLATCTTATEYYKSCKICGLKHASETFYDGQINGHNFTIKCNGEGECEACHTKVNFYSIIEGYSSINFGLYPQSLVEDSTLIGKLNTTAGTLPTESSSGNWKSYGYYISDSITNYMWYIDVEEEGEKYRGVYFTQYRPNTTALSSDESNTNMYGNKFTVPTSAYWFKYEPIKWTVVQEENGIATLVAETILDAQTFQNTYSEKSSKYYNSSSGVLKDTFANDYAYSSIREWLNESFYNTAFDSSLKEIIKLSKYINSDGYTIDYVSLASKNIISTTYNFVVEKPVSKYALSQNASATSSWWIIDSFGENDSLNSQLASGNTENVNAISGVIPVVRILVCNHENCKVETVDPTCTEKGYTKHTCNVCKYVYYDEIKDAKGHKGGTATCTSKAICSVCTQEYGETLPHSYVNGICSGCKEINATEVKKKMSQMGFALYDDVIFFGYYPQTEVKDSTLKNTLNTNAGTLPTSSESGDWKKLYTDSNGNAYMWYIDLKSDGIRYRGIYFTSYRSYSDSNATANEKESYQKGYDTGKVYWFIYEPIKWKIISDTNGIKQLVADLALDSQQFQDVYETKDLDYYHSSSSIYASNWGESDLASWLNDEFKETAFSGTISFDYSKLFETTTQNNKDTALMDGNTKYGSQANTELFAYLLSYQDLFTSSFGYNSSPLLEDLYRQKGTTDYAKVQGINVKNNGKVDYWTRSADYRQSNQVTIATSDGKISGNAANVRSSCIGVVPVITINLCKAGHYLENIVDDNEIVPGQEASCKVYTKYYKTCSVCGYKSNDTFQVENLDPHNYEDTVVTPATCGEEGELKRVCKDCGYEEYVVIPATNEHVGGIATCNRQAVCSECGKSYGETLEHTLVYTKTVAPSCENGYTVYTCTECGEEIHTDYVAGTGHSGGHANCKYKAICTKCGKEYGEIDLTTGHNYVVTVVAPTCCDDGYTLHKCTICGNTYQDNPTQKLGHDFERSSVSAYLISAATCTAPIVYCERCSRCGERSDSIYEDGVPLGHNYNQNDSCSRCGDKLIQRVNEKGVASTTGKYITFGTYPQSLVEDTKIITALNNKLEEMRVTDSKSTIYDLFTLYDYSNQNKGVLVSGMAYIDIWYLGIQYRGVVIREKDGNGVAYRDNEEDSAHLQYKNKYTTGKLYWFEYKKITWKILSQDDGTALVYSTLSLDAQEYLSTSPKNEDHTDWALSSIRTWLNASFYNTAFNDLQKELIIKSNLLNKVASENALSNTIANNHASTNDNIFLLSYADIFSSGYSIDTTNFAMKSTDYAKCQGSRVSSDNENVAWWIRSASKTDTDGVMILCNKAKNYLSTFEIADVVPALLVNLCSHHTYLDGKCSKCGDTLFEKSTTSSGTTITLGTYPQMQASSEIASILNKLHQAPDNNGFYGWESYYYYRDGKNTTTYMYYKDVELFGKKYRGVYSLEYRPSSTQTSSDNEYMIANGYTTQKIYWFVYEPIVWDVLSNTTGTAILVTDSIIDSQNFDIDSSNWILSDIRQWLNDVFYNTVFSKLEQEFINKQFVDNRTTALNGTKNSVAMNQQNSDEYVTLLSYSDLSVENIAKYFGKAYVKISDYAKSQGVKASKDGNNEVNVLLRSANQNNTVSTWNMYQSSESSGNVSNTYYAIKPSISVDICTHNYAFEAGSLICRKCRHIEYISTKTTWQDKTKDLITIGQYPTRMLSYSDLDDKALIQVLNELTGEKPTEKNSYAWNSYKYYSNNVNTNNYMWYLDVEYGGTKYRGVYFTAYRPTLKSGEAIIENSNIDDNGFEKNNVYWFEYTDLTWVNIQTKDGISTYLCTTIIDSQEYDVNDNTYWTHAETNQPCGINKWLNDEFISIAFAGYNTDELVDGVTLVNQNELALFTSYEYKATDYAKIQGVKVDNELTNDTNGCAYWLTQIPADSGLISICTYDKNVLGQYPSSSENGILPVIKFKVY